MSKNIILEIRDDGNVYDANSVMVWSNASSLAPVAEITSNSDKTVELVKLGVSVDEIIKLKNMDLI